MLKLVSSNENKLREFRRLSTTEFDIEIGLDIDEVHSDAQTIAIYKSKDAGDETIVEDTILVIDGKPIIDIGYKLKSIIDNGRDSDAVWETTLAVNSNGLIRLYKSSINGRLIDCNVPDDAFGFDANFIPQGESISLYELSKSGRKDEYSTRKLALASLDAQEHVFEIRVQDVPEWSGMYQSMIVSDKINNYSTSILTTIRGGISSKWKDFFDNLAKGSIPDTIPHEKSIDYIDFDSLPWKTDKKSTDKFANEINIRFMKKELMNTFGMYGPISKSGAKFLKNRFDGKVFIDPIAGRGWFAKALREAGATVIAGDLHADKIDPITDVLCMEGEELIEKYGETSDILILSWAHFDENVDYRCAMKWGSTKPILVYGEFASCCNSEEFVRTFDAVEYISDFPDLSYKPLKNCSMQQGYFYAR